MRLTLPFILASASPRRRELLGGVVDEYEVVTMEVEEAHDPALTPAELTVANARLKTEFIARLHPSALVLGADTLVYLDGEPLGKPRSLDEARSMLRRLSGRTHVVCTGVCLVSGGGAVVHTFSELTEVTFRTLTEETISGYLERVHVLDKAGAYAVQEAGEMIIERVTGSWSNVVGLPVERLRAELAPWVAPAE